ncbi:hypothetical protein F2Q70_00044003 [Brassica cretica]|uniref:Uncharacterized protein n=1 Tax=Brassica cretica TaxID=69181 RepID=A0A8S9KHD2_BRACR|nr:hypothetical protein F2Q70_00044003 [Brassica cretica]
MAIPQLLLSDLKAGGVGRLFSRVVESLWELIWSWFMKRKRRKTWQEVLILLNIEGCVTVWRDYHGDVFAAQAERFFSKLIEKEFPSETETFQSNGLTWSEFETVGDKQSNGITYIHI